MADKSVATRRQAFKFRLYPNANQERELGIMLETHRRLYNACLEQRKTAYEKEKKSIYYGDQSAWFTKTKESNDYYKRVNRSSAQATMRRLEKSFRNFFRRIKKGTGKPGYPRFKGRDYFDSVEFPAYGDGIKLKSGKLYVQNIGMVKIKLHRKIEGKIKIVTLKREAGCWYAAFSCELPASKIKSNKPPVGIDVGLESFLTNSNGDHEPNPRYLKVELPELRRKQRSVSRKKKGGKNRRKGVKRVQRLHARVRNKRREHHHQVALKLVRRFGLIAAERLNIQGMLKNRRLARAISGAGWAGFLSTLRHKAIKVGAAFVEVDAKGTSQECSGCGKLVPKTLKDRWHSCPHCHLSLHRDHNSALVILKRALARTEPTGPETRALVSSGVPRSRRL